MKERDLIELLEGLAYAALEVVDCWSQGDLAGAVNNLEHDAKIVRKVVVNYKRQLKKNRRFAKKGGAA